MSKPPPLQQEVDECLDAFALRFQRAGYAHPYVQAASIVYRWMSKRLDNGDDTRTLESVAKRYTKRRGKK